MNKYTIILVLSIVTLASIIEIIYEKLTPRKWHRKPSECSQCFIPEVDARFTYILLAAQGK